MTGAFGRLAQNWVYGGMLAGVVLILIWPLLLADAPMAARLTLLALPVYMLHQFEEHDADRFRLFVNALLGPTRAGLTIADVFWINFVGVWLFLAVALWLTLRVDAGWGVLAFWLLAINGVVHVLQGIGLRRYNPGLATAVVLFLPLAALILSVTPASPAQFLAGFVLVAGLHAAILFRARRPAAARPA